MLKLFRNLRNEVQVVQDNLAAYPDPSEGLPGAGRMEWYDGKLTDVADSLDEAINRLQTATDKAAAEYADKSSTEEGRNELLAERSGEASQHDAGQATEVAEKGSVTASGGQSGQDAAKEKSAEKSAKK